MYLPSSTEVPPKLHWCVSQVKLVCPPSYADVPPNYTSASQVTHVPPKLQRHAS